MTTYAIYRNGLMIATGYTQRRAEFLVRFEMRRYPKATFAIVAD